MVAGLLKNKEKLVMKSIETLKNRLTVNNTLFVQNENGFTGEMGFEWREPASDLEIKKFEIQHNIILPADFKKFLKISNGAILFKDIQYGQWGCKIYGLDEIIDISNHVKDWGYELKPEWIVFATWLGDCDILIFDLTKSKNGINHYIIDGEQGEEVGDWINIKGNFEKWIDRLIVAQGAKYWRWY